MMSEGAGVGWRLIPDWEIISSQIPLVDFFCLSEVPTAREVWGNIQAAVQRDIARSRLLARHNLPIQLTACVERRGGC